MSTDRELLELAAKAAGYTTNHPWNAERLTLNPPVDALYVMNENGVVHTAWNPLDDSGAAMNLAVDIGLKVCIDLDEGATRILNVVDGLTCMHMHFDGGARKATCRAIVRAAAEIGKAMP